MSSGMSAFVRPLVEPVPAAVGSCQLGSGLLWPRLAGIFSQLALHRLCQRHPTGERPDHHVQLVDQSLLIDVG
jgi:hypothetical protein